MLAFAADAPCCNSVDTPRDGPRVEYYCNDSKKLRYGQSSLCKIRNERNFRARRPKAAQVAVNRAWHDA